MCLLLRELVWDHLQSMLLLLLLLWLRHGGRVWMDLVIGYDGSQIRWYCRIGNHVATDIITHATLWHQLLQLLLLMLVMSTRSVHIVNILTLHRSMVSLTTPIHGRCCRLLWHLQMMMMATRMLAIVVMNLYLWVVVLLVLWRLLLLLLLLDRIRACNGRSTGGGGRIAHVDYGDAVSGHEQLLGHKSQLLLLLHNQMLQVLVFSLQLILHLRLCRCQYHRHIRLEKWERVRDHIAMTFYPDIRQLFKTHTHRNG